MREFKVACIDNETGYAMVANECSYNVACSYLSDTSKLKFEGSRSLSDGRMALYMSNEERDFTYIYDEPRGYLMLAGSERKGKE